MEFNWSVILNVLFLTGVIVAIVRMIRVKKDATKDVIKDDQPRIQPSLNLYPDKADEVIAVRKINQDLPSLKPTLAPVSSTILNPTKEIKEHKAFSLMIFLLAKENRQLAGYELLQTILSVGLRFGEGHLFHRHQHPNGQGPVLCSLATATASGVFDLQNIGAFSVHGLCLFMEASGNTMIDMERFAIMLDTAKQLSEGLDTYLLDDQRQPWSEASEVRYVSQLKNSEPVLVA